MAQTLVSRMRDMSLRVAQILWNTERPAAPGFGSQLGLSAGMLALVLGAAPYTPPLVAFQQHIRAEQQATRLKRGRGPRT